MAPHTSKIFGIVTRWSSIALANPRPLNQISIPNFRLEKILSSNNPDRVFTFRFVEVDNTLRLELINTTDNIFRQVEILTIFLKDELSVGGPSQSHIKFEVIDTIRAREKIIVRHRTWEGGRPIAIDLDQLKRLELIPGKDTPYILDLSWQDPHGKQRFQRIPVGH